MGPWKAYKTNNSQPKPIELVKSDCLETIKNKKIRSDYKRNLELLQKWFVTIDQIIHSKASHFFEWANQNEKVRNRTTRNGWRVTLTFGLSLRRTLLLVFSVGFKSCSKRIERDLVLSKGQ